MYLSRAAVTAINVIVTCPFWASAIAKAADLGGTVVEVTAIGLPVPVFVATMTILVQAGGSISVIAGLFAPLGAALLAIFSLAASFLVHPFWAMPPEAFVPNFAAFTANMGLIGGLIAATILTTFPGARYR